MISVLDTSSIVKSFKIIKFKRKLKKSNYYFYFGFFKDSLNVFKL
jgi:hypothetical protein